MTREMITAGPEDELDDMMDVMTKNKFRHLPVVEGDRTRRDQSRSATS